MFIKPHLKMILYSLIIICLLAGFCCMNASPAQAQSTDELRFDLFGYTEQTLHAPYATTSYEFGLPADWNILEGSSVHLDMAVYFDLPNHPDSEPEPHGLGGLLQVVFNEKNITTILLDVNGKQSFNIPLPVETLKPSRTDGRHELVLNYINEEYCLYGSTVTVVILSSSRLILPHQDGNISTDLAQFPYPIYLKNSFLASSAVLVIPDQPTSGELNSAFTTAAGFGRMTGGALQLYFVPLGQLTSELSKSQNLVFVGKRAGFPILDGITLPISLAEWTSKYPEDGVIYQVISPWNQAKVVLFVTGSTDVAVLKAAQTLGSGMVFGNVQPDLAVIQQVNPETIAQSTAVDMTLADLGYQTETINQVGLIQREFQFYVPLGMAVSGDANINLYYSHSTLLDYDRSGIVLYLNNEPIGSIRFTDKSSQDGNIIIAIPPTAVRVGLNKLVFNAQLKPTDLCVSLSGIEVWLTIRGESQIHLPLSTVPEGVTSRALDLGFYPMMFTLSPSNQSLAFVIPPNNLAAWRVANKIAFNLGDQTNWSVSEIEVAFADNIPDSLLQDRDIFVIGRPSEQPILDKLGDSLPVPFDPGGNLPKTQKLPVVYRIVQGTSVGFLELLPSPWNKSHAILAVLGNTDEGLLWSGSALITPGLRAKLSGDFAVVHSEDILTGNSKLGAFISPIITTLPGAEIKPDYPNQPVTNPRPTWLVLVLVIVFTLIFFIIIYVLIHAWRQNKQHTA